MKEKRIIIDTDPAISIPKSDIDDGLAIFMALNSPELNVEGISTVYGNSTLEQVTAVAKDILKVADRQDIPILKGAYNKKWLGIKTEATEFLSNHISENPNEITLVTLGPLTNVATVIKQKPEIIDDLKQLVIMGGLIFPDKLEIPLKFLNAEFNIANDGLAANIVFSQPIETTLIGLEVTTQVLFQDVHYEAIKNANTQISKYLTKHILPWLTLSKVNNNGFNPHDPIALAYLLKDSLYQSVKLGLSVNYKKRDFTNIDKKYRMSLSGVLSKREGKISIIPDSEISVKKKIRVCTEVDEKAFLKLLIDRLIK